MADMADNKITFILKQFKIDADSSMRCANTSCREPFKQSSIILINECEVGSKEVLPAEVLCTKCGWHTVAYINWSDIDWNSDEQT